jgi:hypothetical protein
MCPDDEFLPLHVSADEDAKGSAVRILIAKRTFFLPCRSGAIFTPSLMLIFVLISISVCTCVALLQMGAFSNLSDDEDDEPKSNAATAAAAAADSAKLDEVDMSVLSPPSVQAPGL